MPKNDLGHLLTISFRSSR